MSSRLSSQLCRSALLYGFAVLLCLLILVKYFGLHRVKSAHTPAIQQG